jgi:hypothetical protein
VRDGDASVGYELGKTPSYLVDVRDPVVDEEDLSFSK